MKFNQWILGLAVVGILCAQTAKASLGFDLYKAANTYILANPQNIGVNAGVGVITNGPVDLVKLGGTAIINFQTITNTGTTGGTLTATLYGSPDQTNLTALANYWLITSTTADTITNFYYGSTNLIATNSLLLPYTLTTPNAAVSGWATQYPVYSPATNTGAITLNGNKNVQVGVQLDDQPRYLYVVYTAGGTVTNFTTAAQLITVTHVTR